MSRSHPSEQEEIDFMKNLLAGLDPDASFWDATLTPDPSPVKKTVTSPKTPARSSRHTCLESVTKAFKTPLTASRLDDAEAEELMKGVEDWDWDADYEISPKKPSPKKSKVSPKKPQRSKATPYIRETCTRCVVQTIGEIEEKGKTSKQLIVKVCKTEEQRSVILSDDWALTDVREGDTINVIGEFFPLPESSSSVTSSVIISSRQNLVILHPDTLVTATALSTAAHCRRKALLSGLIRSSTDTTPSLVWGHMLHTVFQACLAAWRWDNKWIDQQIDEVVRGNLADLVRIEMNVEMARSQVKARAKGIQTFFNRYLSESPKPEAVLSNTRAGRGQSTLLAISDLLDVEEDIWSPTYGLKGKIDATVQTTISEKTFLAPQPTLTYGPKPLEIKTGRSVGVLEHRAQTMLYTLLAQERYGMEVSSGLLFYTQQEEVIQVPQSQIELKHLILARNEIAAYQKRRQVGLKLGGESSSEPFLPPTIDDERTCKRCYSIDSCMLYRKAVENVEDTSSPIADAYNLKTGHLTSSQAAFFKDWEHLLSLEEHDVHKFRKELWTMGAAEREAKGRCLSSMALDTSFKPSPLPTTATRDGKIHAFTYRFVRAAGSPSSASLLNGLLDVNDAITVSVEPHLIALAHGFILSLTPTEVVVGVDHDLSLEHIRSRPNMSNSEAVIYRIDRDELQGGMARIRDNLAQMFYADGDSRRLELVVDLRKPCFHDPSTFPLPPAAAKYTAHLNPHQREAVKKVLTAQDYALVLGMPGTGKTTVIAAIIKVLVEMGKTVLLTSYTHSAVDTILMKLNDDVDFTILRMGNVDKVHPDVRHLTLSARIPATTVEQLEHQLMTPPVIATTCLSIDQGLFSRRQFDYCIVDEASQITLPTCLGPLRFADKFVLVGDHFQLPPLVRNPLARKGGLDVSLFRRLSDAHPGSVVDLAYQYRMNADIMLLSNKLIYGNRLHCGSEEVARQTLVLPDRSFLQNMHHSTPGCSGGAHCWIERLMDERCKAVFVDTDLVPCHDSKVGDLVQNEGEANIIYQITETLLHCGLYPSQLGIISLYRQQIKVLSQKLKSRSGIEFLTADKSQGRDKDCIIISLVRSNSTGSIGDLVRDWRRMNVSFTRARSKLIIVGSRKTLADIELLHEFFVLMEEKGWILQLPAGADVAHSEVFIPIMPVSPRVKRHAEDGDAVTKESPMLEPPQKRQKKVEVEGLLRGRPILQDLVNDTK